MYKPLLSQVNKHRLVEDVSHNNGKQGNFYGPSKWKKNWDHLDKLIEKLKTQMIKARSKKGKLKLSEIY